MILALFVEVSLGPSEAQSNPPIDRTKDFPLVYHTNGISHSWSCYAHKKDAGQWLSLPITIEAPHITPQAVSDETRIRTGFNVSRPAVQYLMDLLHTDPYQVEWRRLARAMIKKAEEAEMPADELAISFTQSFPYRGDPPRYP